MVLSCCFHIFQTHGRLSGGADECWGLFLSVFPMPASFTEKLAGDKVSGQGVTLYLGGTGGWSQLFLERVRSFLLVMGELLPRLPVIKRLA